MPSLPWKILRHHKPIYTPHGATLEPSSIEMLNLSGPSPSPNSNHGPASRDSDGYVYEIVARKPVPTTSDRAHPSRWDILSFNSQRLKELQGYHFGVMCCAVIASSVAIINIVFISWAIATSGVHGDLGTLQEGSCHQTNVLTLWIHLAINILGTLLLGASNYSMQCLSSPTRREIDRAHNKGIWLDIGVPSIRNLRRLSATRILLWWLLALSSIPLHLLYNSAVFSSQSTREFNVFVVSKDFFEGAPFSADLYGHVEVWGGLPDADLTPYQDRLGGLQQNKTSWTQLENEACIKAYTPSILSSRADVVLVSSTSNSTNSLLSFSADISAQITTNSVWQSLGWMCSMPYYLVYYHCSHFQHVENPRDWSIWIYPRIYSNQSYDEVTPIATPVQYCLSQPVQEDCKLQFSVGIMMAVIVCNLVKAISMGFIAWKQDPEPLVTLGDAIKSFLNQPDPTTEGNCVVQKSRFERSKVWGRLPSRWRAEPFRWFRAASIRRWLTCNTLCLSALIASGVLLKLGLDAVTSKHFSHLWSLGLGTITPETFIFFSQGTNYSAGYRLVAIMLLANLPQLLLSFLYFAYNSIFTCMLLAQEWNEYARKRKPLRVTSPVGRQRGSYRLQLPYRYGIPLLIGSGILHWLVSQSIFLVRISSYQSTGTLDIESGISTCGYSPIAIIFVIGLGSIIVLLGIANGFRVSRSGMPLVGSCSAAISAACHPPQGDLDASSRPVMWGVVAKEDTEISDDDIGHCSFTSFEVEAPTPGKWYA